MKKIAGLVLLFLLGVACAVNPVTGKKELSLISEQEEIALGQKTDGEIRNQYGVYDDPALQSYIESIGNRLTPGTHRPNLKYHFAVLDSPVINAFALPGGYIYVTRGIMALMGSEAELSVVLGHELGHVNARHSVRRLSQMLFVQLGLAVGSALSDTFAKISGVASVGIQLLFLKYSRDDERQADALAVEYVRKGTYNPGEMIRFFASLQKMGDLSDGQSLPGFLSTHPLTSERIQNVKLLLARADQTLAVKNEPYLRQVEDIIYGEDPRQGFAEGSAFYHPILQFSFFVPNKWKLQNTPSQVSLSSADGNAAVIFQAEKSGENLAAYAQNKAASIEGRQFINDQSLAINGLASYHQLYDVTQADKETLRIRLSFIKKDSCIFTFLTLATALDFRKYDPEFQRIVNSFQELRDRAYLGRQPQRLILARANGRQILQDIFQQSGMKKDIWPKIAVLNGLELSSTPEPNQLIKLVK